MDVKLVEMVFLALIGAEKSGAAEKIKVDVYVQTNNWRQPMARPEALASEVFARVDVSVAWHAGELPATPCIGRRCIGIRMVAFAPASLSRGALASARLYGSSGSLISVYEDRVQHLIGGLSSLSDVLLGYIFAHEMAHVMLGYDYHSDSGVLKAHWSYADYAAMRARSLAFADDDAKRIHAAVSFRLMAAK